MIWAIEQMFEGWTCSECEWKYPIPELLADPQAKDAYDRIASTNFKRHDCDASPKGRKPRYEEANIERLRKLVMRGLKPKDAVEIMLQEVVLERGKNQEQLKKLVQTNRARQEEIVALFVAHAGWLDPLPHQDVTDAQAQSIAYCRRQSSSITTQAY